MLCFVKGPVPTLLIFFSISAGIKSCPTDGKKSTVFNELLTLFTAVLSNIFRKNCKIHVA